MDGTIIRVPGCVFSGYITSREVNGGSKVPLFEPVASCWRQSINTKEGWDAAAIKQNTRSFVLKFGRTPRSVEEVDAWLKTLL